MKSFAITLVIVSAGLLYLLLGDHLSIEALKAHEISFRAYYQLHPARTIAAFCVVYVIMKSVSFPPATVLTIGAGALFGTVLGTVIVAAASAVGETVALLIARYLLRDHFRRKYAARLVAMDRMITANASLYVLTLRIVPVMPFYVVNAVMAMTSIESWRFAIASFAGLLVGAVVYVHAGSRLGDMEHLSDATSLGMLLTLTAVAGLPLALNWAWIRLRYLKMGPAA